MKWFDEYTARQVWKIVNKLIAIADEIDDFEDYMIDNDQNRETIKTKKSIENKFQSKLIELVDFEYLFNKYTPDIGDWLEENYPDDIINRAERIENERNAERIEMMSAKEKKADRLEYESNAKRGE